MLACAGVNHIPSAMSTIRRFLRLNEWLASIHSPAASDRKAALVYLGQMLAGDMSHRPPPPVTLPGQRANEPAPAPSPSPWRRPAKWT
jgi:hypothetical protein